MRPRGKSPEEKRSSGVIFGWFEGEDACEVGFEFDEGAGSILSMREVLPIGLSR